MAIVCLRLRGSFDYVGYNSIVLCFGDWAENGALFYAAYKWLGRLKFSLRLYDINCCYYP